MHLLSPNIAWYKTGTLSMADNSKKITGHGTCCGMSCPAQLRYYQRQIDGWQHIMTGEGEVTLDAPDGTQVTLSSFKNLTADVVGKMDKSELENEVGHHP
ncbi:hypothetical protein D8L93_03520 [Sodalis-like symbiont of Bactericera trigonica]|nr:hypothetical protein D8L93_03520 [Sodalis-like symbiont of Bactericera trigonica]